MKKQNIIKFLPFLFLINLLMLAACAPSDGETPAGASTQTQSAGDNARLADTAWVLDSYGPSNAQTEAIGESDLTLQFDGNVKAGGFGGCNTFGAEYDLVGEDQLVIEEIIATEIACEAEGIMEQELAYFEALRSVNRFEMSGDQLILWYNDGQSALNFSRLTGSTPIPVTPSPGT